MLRFFRQIRQRLLTENKFSKYLLYAIGEIALVIIGILLALQINEWNSQRTEARMLRNDLEYVLEDLKEDKAALFTLRDQRKTGVQGCAYFLDRYMRGEKIAYNKGNQETNRLKEVLYERKYKRNQNGFEKVLSSKRFQSAEFKTLREKMDAYVNEIDRLIYDEERLNYFIEENELKMFAEGTHTIIYEYLRVSKGYANKEVAVSNFDWQELLKGKSALKSILLRYEDDVHQFLVPQYNKTAAVGNELATMIETYLNKH